MRKTARGRFIRYIRVLLEGHRGVLCEEEEEVDAASWCLCFGLGEGEE